MSASKIRTSAGSTIAICVTTLPATYDAAGYGALTYVPVGEVSDLGTVGKVFTVTKFSPLGTRIVVKRKGSADPGTMTVKTGWSPTDAGQAALVVARDSDTSSSFKVTSQSGTIMYFTAQTSGTPIAFGTVDQITTQDFTLDIDSDFTFTNITA